MAVLNYHEELRIKKISMLLEGEKCYSFPDFLVALRKIFGINRKIFCEEIGISENRMCYLENGKFQRMPSADELMAFNMYYGVSEELLKSKAIRYLKNRKLVLT